MFISCRIQTTLRATLILFKSVVQPTRDIGESIKSRIGDEPTDICHHEEANKDQSMPDRAVNISSMLHQFTKEQSLQQTNIQIQDSKLIKILDVADHMCIIQSQNGNIIEKVVLVAFGLTLIYMYMYRYILILFCGTVLILSSPKINVTKNPYYSQVFN